MKMKRTWNIILAFVFALALLLCGCKANNEVPVGAPLYRSAEAALAGGEPDHVRQAGDVVTSRALETGNLYRIKLYPEGGADPQEYFVVLIQAQAAEVQGEEETGVFDGLLTWLNNFNDHFPWLLLPMSGLLSFLLWKLVYPAALRTLLVPAAVAELSQLGVTKGELRNVCLGLQWNWPTRGDAAQVSILQGESVINTRLETQMKDWLRSISGEIAFTPGGVSVEAQLQAFVAMALRPSAKAPFEMPENILVTPKKMYIIDVDVSQTDVQWLREEEHAQDRAGQLASSISLIAFRTGMAAKDAAALVKADLEAQARQQVANVLQDLVNDIPETLELAARVFGGRHQQGGGGVSDAGL